jgi:hypothetical protein
MEISFPNKHINIIPVLLIGHIVTGFPTIVYILPHSLRLQTELHVQIALFKQKWSWSELSYSVRREVPNED